MSETIIPVDIAKKHEEDYLWYAIFVARRRVAPDERDGLKPVHRRVMWAAFHDERAYPKVLGGDDDIINLRPLQWQNNLSKGDDFPYYFSAVSAQERNNVESVLQFKLNDDLISELKIKYNF